MKISVDGGALNQKASKRYGTSIFSENLVKALQLYDKKNQYQIYTFDNLRPKIFWMKGRISIEEFKQKKDIFLALNQAVPLYTAGKVINFCHGLSYRFYPELYSKKDVIRLNKQLREMIKRSDKIIVSSEKVKKELLSVNKSINSKIVVLPFGVPFDMKRHKNKNRQKFFLYVGMNHPIKNTDFIKKAFNEFKKNNKYSDFKLYVLTENITRKKLKRYYQQATALLTASHYESFNFPVLEALSQGCPVIGLKSAIIPELKQYVNLATDIDGFIKNMNKIKIKPNEQMIKQIEKKFNWKNYVRNLVKLY
ncbi:MAG: glycosyltransferase [Patescibacteria group bacterium]|jgi:glycosyltransferase involved in cell wall biosynthesis